MTTLPTNLRKDLSRVVVQARELAEAGARVALKALAVHHHEPYPHMDMEARKLRNRLRAHSRQLGDRRDPRSGAQAIRHLVEEFAYEHWHRMLFARFLAENDLLIDPELEVAITLDECRQLAREEGTDQWTLAGRYAQRMLPQIFRAYNPVFQVDFARNDRVRLEQLLESLPGEVFQASDSLGWVYQFWQAKKKAEVNASEVKIGADELPAVTQLFTEPYMVHFLLDNSLGAWWAARNLSEVDLKNASSEDELRSKVAIPGVLLDYLRFLQQEDGTWTPATGTFDGWPEHLNELKILDPCCGSGHFLVAAFLMLVPMRMELEGLSVREAVDVVLLENIHGLELDQRCVELAAFALALTAWKYPSAGGYRPLPELNVACSGLAISARKEEWLALAGDNTNLSLALEELFKLFKDAPVLGSLIQPEFSLGKDSLFELRWEDVKPLLTKLLHGKSDYVITEMGIVANGLSKAAELLQKKYELIITNVPFRQSDDLVSTLNKFFKKHYPLSKSDIATVFHQRLLALLSDQGAMSFVMPQGFLYKDYYAKYRKETFSRYLFALIARLGSRAFGEISGEEVKVILSVVVNKKPTHKNFLNQIDATIGEAEKKERSLKSSTLSRLSQSKALVSKKYIVAFDNKSLNNKLLENFASFSNGIQTGDYPRFGRYFWEKECLDTRWEFQLSTVRTSTPYGGREHCLHWGDGELEKFIEEKVGEGRTASWLRGLSCRGQKGVAISAMGKLKATLFTGEIFDDNTIVLLPKSEEHLSAIWEFCSSSKYNALVREIDQSNKVRGALLRVPFNVEDFGSGGELPEIRTSDLRQWIYHGHPADSNEALQNAVARLLGYRWPAELDANMEMSNEQREWVNRCDALLPYADDDGIVCLPAINQELPAHERLVSLLQAAWSDDWHPGILSQLLDFAGCKGKTLEVWLQDKFFEQHCKLFQNRPFIWHIWDGLRDGFSALVNYHTLDQATLDRLIYSYLGIWIRDQDAAARAGENGAEERLAAAKGLKQRLEAIKAGEPPLDIFVRWKPIEKHPIGWDPDFNDGVRLNIRPFMMVDDVGRKGAGVLRWKPNIHWKKDRGKDLVSAPWYPVFQGDRINDHHLSLEEKKAARAARDSAG